MKHYPGADTLIAMHLTCQHLVCISALGLQQVLACTDRLINNSLVVLLNLVQPTKDDTLYHQWYSMCNGIIYLCCPQMPYMMSICPAKPALVETLNTIDNFIPGMPTVTAEPNTCRKDGHDLPSKTWLLRLVARNQRVVFETGDLIVVVIQDWFLNYQFFMLCSMPPLGEYKKPPQVVSTKICHPTCTLHHI